MEDKVLVHHGIKGQKWGVRRFQNEDGSRTAAGKARERDNSKAKAVDSKISKLTEEKNKALNKIYEPHEKELDDLYEKAMKEDPNLDFDKSEWKKIYDIEASLGIEGRKTLDKYYSEVSKIADDYLNDYFNDHESLSINEASKRFKNSGEAIVDALFRNYAFDEIDYDYVFKKK